MPPPLTASCLTCPFSPSMLSPHSSSLQRRDCRRCGAAPAAGHAAAAGQAAGGAVHPRNLQGPGPGQAQHGRPPGPAGAAEHGGGHAGGSLVGPICFCGCCGSDICSSRPAGAAEHGGGHAGGLLGRELVLWVLWFLCLSLGPAGAAEPGGGHTGRLGRVGFEACSLAPACTAEHGRRPRRWVLLHFVGPGKRLQVCLMVAPPTALCVPASLPNLRHECAWAANLPQELTVNDLEQPAFDR